MISAATIVNRLLEDDADAPGDVHSAKDDALHLLTTHEDWTQLLRMDAIRYFKTEDVEVEEDTNNSEKASIKVDGVEYTAWKSDDDAEAEALERVTTDLNDQPEMFNQDWLKGHVDDEKLANYLNIGTEHWDEEVDGMDDEELVQKLVDEDFLDNDVFFKLNGQLRVINDFRRKRIESAKERYREDRRPAPEDPWDYLEGMYRKDEIMKHVGEMGVIDVDAAAKSAVSTDGWQHFLSHYDGHSIDLPGGAVLVRS